MDGNVFSFTKRKIEELSAPAKGRAVYRDRGARGLGILVQTSGHKSFHWQRKVNGYPRWETLGMFPDLTVELARARAEELNAKLGEWRSKRFETEDPFRRRSEVMLDQLVDEYVEKRIKPHAKKPADAEKTLRWLVARHLNAWRGRKLGAIRPDDVTDLHRAIGAKHQRTANMVAQTVRRLYRFAEREKLWSGDDPTKGVMFYREKQRTRFLQPDELPRFWAALCRAPNPDFVDYVNLALWTAARKSDVLGMRWQDVSVDDNRWTIPDPKARTPYAVPLSNEAAAILKVRLRRRADGNPWVFPNARNPTRHLVSLDRPWKQLLIDAGLYRPGDPELKITQHDLRRTKASWMAGQGTSLQIIGKMLGHANINATQVYARLNLDPVRIASEAANAALGAAMRKKPKLLPAATARKREVRRG